MPLPTLPRSPRTLRSYYRYCLIPSPLGNVRYRIPTAVEDAFWLMRLTWPAFASPSLPRPVAGLLCEILDDFVHLCGEGIIKGIQKNKDINKRGKTPGN